MTPILSPADQRRGCATPAFFRARFATILLAVALCPSARGRAATVGAAEPVAASEERVNEELAAIDREVSRLRAAGQTVQADELDRKAQPFRDRAAGKPQPPSDEPELHVIGLYEGQEPDGKPRAFREHKQGVAAVEVTVTDRPVVLALCAYEPVKWAVKVAEGVRLRRVILGGYYDQEVVGLPAGVPVTTRTYAGKSPAYFNAYQKDPEHYGKVVSVLKDETGLNPSTFQGTYRYAGKPFVVGPADADWAAQRLLTDLRPLHESATVFERDRQRERVAVIRFGGVYFAATDAAAAAVAERARPGFGASGSFAEFTPLGPVDSSLRPLPGRLGRAVVDPRGPTVYAADDHDLYVINPKDGTATHMAPDPRLPKVSWVGGLAFDTRRRRVLLLGHDGGGARLYAYDPAGKAGWSFLGQTVRCLPQSLAYAPEADALYMLTVPHEGGRATIRRLNPASGALVREVQTSEPVAAAQPPGAPPHQLAAAGGQLALLAPPLPDVDDPDMPVRMRCYLIDAASGRVTYQAPVEPPHAAATKAVAPEEVDALWQELRDADDERADLILWRLL